MISARKGPEPAKIPYNGGRLGGFIAPLLIGAVANAGGFTAGLATTVVAFHQHRRKESNHGRRQSRGETAGIGDSANQ
jgi:hypothetical protein